MAKKNELKRQQPRKGYILTDGNGNYSDLVFPAVNAEPWVEIPVTDEGYQEWLKVNNLENEAQAE